MKKLLPVFITILLLTAGHNTASATYLCALDMALTCVSGNDYRVTFVLYRDCGGIQAPATVSIQFKCTSNPAQNFVATNVPQTAWSGQQIIPSCAAMPTQCIGGSLYGVQEYSYEAIVTLPGCNKWIASWTSCCRGPNDNIIAPTSQSAYIEVTLNNLDAPGSSAPVLANVPVPILCQGMSNYQNPGAIDLDGDSLAIKLVTPYNSSNTTYLSYVLPYSATQPLPSIPPVSMDLTTGELRMTPTMAFVAVVAIRAEKWRMIGGVQTLIGTAMRDMQVTVISCNSQMPELSGMDTTHFNGYSTNDSVYSVDLCVGNTISFTMWGNDNDVYNASNPGSPEKFSVSWNQGIPSGTFQTFNQNTDSARANFTWTPTPYNIREQPHCFVATIRDGACPYNLRRDYLFCIRVKGLTVDLGPDISLCKDGTVTLQAVTGSSPMLYAWSVDGVPAGMPQPSNQFTFNAAGLPPGQHTIAVTVNNMTQTLPCPGHDEIILQIMPDPQPFLGNDTTIGLTHWMFLDAGFGYAGYQWSTGATSPQILIDSTGIGQGTGTFWVKVTDSIGCEGYDTIQVSFVTNPGIAEADADAFIRVIPNPSDGTPELQCNGLKDGIVRFDLFTPDGKMVKQFEMNVIGNNNTFRIDLSHLPDGLYLVQATWNEGVLTEKLMIRK